MVGDNKKGAKTRKAPSSRTWGGRFASATDAGAQAFTASIGFDLRLYPYDVRVSQAHARMLAASGIITSKESERIVAALAAIEEELEAGRFVPALSDEDIHMAIERRLIEKTGDVGAKLHAARSRNDQVVTDVKLFIKDAISALGSGLTSLRGALRDVIRRHPGAIMPGYTHMQRAQPVLLGHHMLAYHDMFERDGSRLSDCLKRTDVLPLGSGALAGTTLPIKSSLVAKELGFSRVTDNSMDAVADRDFVIEFLSVVAILFSHLSRLATDVTVWATSEFGFVHLDDAFSTGSSMMPQKKNPDIAELVRGKSGRAFGNLMAVLTVMKGLPLSYNSDLQEDKEALFDSADTAIASVDAMAKLLASLSFDEEAMAAAASDGLLLATDLAEYLVARGVPFREAHEITGRVVRHCLETGVDLGELGAADLRGFSEEFGDDVSTILSAERAVARRRSPGGTSGTNIAKRMKELDG